jgi:hypothetical protein
MSQQLRFQGVHGDECNCGRRASIRHCPSCGSARIYAYAHPEYHTNLAGDIELVNQLFRCYGCGHKFIDAERQFCEAPPFGVELAKLKVRRLAEAKQRGEYLRPDEQKVAEILEKVQEHIQEEPNEPLPVVKGTVEAEAVVETLPTIDLEHPGLTQAEYNVAEKAFKLEWVNRRLMGQDTGMKIEDYVARRMKGEIIE